MSKSAMILEGNLKLLAQRYSRIKNGRIVLDPPESVKNWPGKDLQKWREIDEREPGEEGIRDYLFRV